jgi:serine/threonine-protein kinase
VISLGVFTTNTSSVEDTQPSGIGPVDRLPERLGRFTVIGMLGRGGFGSVYLARDEALGRLVAIKVAHRGILGSPEHVESFLAEARMAAGLGHPGIIRVYDVGHSDGGDVFVVFEYVEGRNLLEILKGEQISPSRVAELMVEVAEAADHAHQAGLIHRDLKPSNILIDGRGEPHIADFGLAVREDLQHLRTGEVAGTPAYMAPEQARGGTASIGPWTDVYALGMILYEMLAGRRPFQAGTIHELLRQVRESKPVPPSQWRPELPRELDAICLKCLEKEPEHRYPTAMALAKDLQRFLHGKPVLAAPPRVWERLRRFLFLLRE